MPDAEPVEINYDATSVPTLGRMMVSDARVRVAMGPFGSGKSSACVVELLRRAAIQRPMRDGIRRTRAAVVRNTYRELSDTTRKTFEQWIPGAVGKWQEQPFTFTIRMGDIESEILFRALDRPEDVKKLLSLELTYAYINELREMPKAIFDGLQLRVGRYPAKKDGGATWRGIWADTNPWHTGHWASKLFRTPLPGFEIYRQPGGRSVNAENRPNIDPDYYESGCVGKDAEWIRIYMDGLEGSSDEGSIFGRQLESVPVTAFAHGKDEVFAGLDLGRSDATAIWFWQYGPKGVDIIDHYQNSGPGLAHYFSVMDEKGYKYRKIWLPFDATAMTLATESSVLSQFLEHFGAARVGIGPRQGVADGIAAARWLLEQAGTRFHSRCDVVRTGEEMSGLGLLREYRFAWDEHNQCFGKLPVHDFASDTGDAFRYLATVVKISQEMLPKPKAPPPEIRGRVSPDGKLTTPLDDMLEEHGRSSRRRSRI